jgi:hypothetical protein
MNDNVISRCRISNIILQVTADFGKVLNVDRRGLKKRWTRECILKKHRVIQGVLLKKTKV